MTAQLKRTCFIFTVQSSGLLYSSAGDTSVVITYMYPEIDPQQGHMTSLNMFPAKSLWAGNTVKIDDVVGKRAMLPANLSPQTRPRWKRSYVLNQPFILKYVC